MIGISFHYWVFRATRDSLLIYPTTLSTRLGSTWGNSPIATLCLVTALASSERKS